MSVSLVKFLQQLDSDKNIEVELKNGTVVEGAVISVDRDMNMHMKSVKVVVRGRDAIHYPQFTIKGTSIMFVKLPKDLQYESMLEKCQ